MGFGYGLVLYVALLLVIGFGLYVILRKGIAHGIRDARRAAARENSAPNDLP